ncbi:MAG: serine protease, partial [Ruminococcaceae bacterium]|nr:serine protease [Oscillospiraceae bacterium]
LKDGDSTLGEKLVSAGVFTTEAYMEYFNPEKFNVGNFDVENSENATATKALSANDIYEKCSSAVFYIEVYNANGQAYASGSGFFINANGIAVTNYHVIKDASYAKIKTRDNKEYDVIGIYDYDDTQDWAVLKIDGADFDYLELSQSSVNVGDTIYAIGSPVGFDDTITAGIVSNAQRRIRDINYIQISAPISHGSSGGALLNTEGQVIGITSAGIDTAQNLNFALPISCIENADISEYTPLIETEDEEISYASVKYNFSQQSVSMKEGREVSIDFSYELENTDIEKTMIVLQSQDARVARAYFKTTGSFPWEIVIVGVGDGETTIKVSNLLTDETAEIQVSVLENKIYGDILFYPEEYKHTVYAGESNTFKISMIKYNIPDDIEATFAAQVKDSSKAKIGWIMVNGEVLLKVTGLSPGVTSIMFTNTVNQKTLSIPLTVYPSYKQNLDLLKECVAKTGEYDKANDMYVVSRYDEEDNVAYSLAYRKSEDKVFFISVLKAFDKVMSITIEVTDGHVASGAVVLEELVGAFEVNPRTFDETEQIYFSMMIGDKSLQAQLQNGLNLNAAVMLTLYGCDEHILSEYDLYFEDFGYSCFNRRFRY